MFIVDFIIPPAINMESNDKIARWNGIVSVLHDSVVTMMLILGRFKGHVYSALAGYINDRWYLIRCRTRTA